MVKNTQKRMRSFLEQPKTGTGYLDEVTLLRKDGSKVWAENVSTYLLNKNTGRVEVQGLSRDISQRKRLEQELQHQVITDELTKTFNRRHFFDVAQNELKRATRLKHPLAVAIIDVDYFKQVNDTYGHPAGDQALIIFAERCQRFIREIDVFARFGGDEFVLLLPETTCEQARAVMERVHKAVSARPFDLDGVLVPITLTAGIACLKLEKESLDELLIRADHTLYRAKEAGRNRVFVDSYEKPETQ